MKRIVFIGSIFSEDRAAEIRAKSRGQIANANNTLQKALINGLSYNRQHYPYELYIFNMPNIGAFPLKYHDIYFKGNDFEIDRVQGKNISFFNLIRLKHFFKYKAIKAHLCSFLSQHPEDNIFLVYDLYEPFLRALYQLRMDFDFKVCVIVPDLPGYTGVPHRLIYRMVTNRKSKRRLFKVLSGADAFVLLCSSMKEKLPINEKPYIIMEGVFNARQEISASYDAEDIHTLFYSGALDERNGILILLKAFSLIRDKNYRCIICGDGYDRSAVIDAARSDRRIEYKGQLPHEEVLILQKTSTLLINPRQPIDEFTKYSFPSKTMEYMASGTPLLMYKLPTIPKEYFLYCFALDDLSAEALASKIVEICEMDRCKREKVGYAARNFILNNKNEKLQTARILGLLSTL